MITSSDTVAWKVSPALLIFDPRSWSSRTRMLVPTGSSTTSGGGGVVAADVAGAGPAPAVPPCGAWASGAGAGCDAWGVWVAELFDRHALNGTIASPARTAKRRDLRW